MAHHDVDDPRAVAPVPDRTSRLSSTGGARPAPKPKKAKDKPKRPRNRRHGRNR